MFNHLDLTPWECRRYAIADRLGLFGLCLLAFSGLTGSSLVDIGMVTLISAVLITLPECWQTLRRDPLFWLSVVLVSYVLVRAYLAYLEFPELRDARNPKLRDLLRVTGTISVVAGLFLQRNPARRKLILACAALGLVIWMLGEFRWDRVDQIGFTHRSIFDTNPNIVGLISAAGMLGGLVWFLSSVARPIVNRAMGMAGSVLLTLFTTSTLVLSQSRSAWLAAMLVVPAVISIWLWVKARRADGIYRLSAFSIGAISVLVLAIAVGPLAHVIGDRWDRTRSDVQALQTTDRDRAGSGNIGVRLTLWKIGAEAIRERPILGWGPGAGEMLVKDRPELPKAHKHFHNLYIELWVSFGLIGLGLYLAVYMLFARAIISQCKSGTASLEMLLFVLGALMLFAVVVLFQIRINDHTGVYYLVLLGTLAAANRARISESHWNRRNSA